MFLGDNILNILHASFMVVPPHMHACSPGLLLLLLYKMPTTPLETFFLYTNKNTRTQMAESVPDSLHLNVTKLPSDSLDLPVNGGHGSYSYSKYSYYQVCLTLATFVSPMKTQKLDE
jgi:hypothetical protein